MDLDALKKRLQSFFTDGLVTIIGSGLSCAEGLPSMHDIANVLSEKIPSECAPSDLIDWEKINKLLHDGLGLEEAISSIQISIELEDIIIKIVAQCVQHAESLVIKECIEQGRELKISSLLPHLSPQNPKLSRIVTTNYDRLIEISGELQGFWIDTGFCGKSMGCFDPQRSKYQGSIGRSTSGKNNVNPVFPNRIQLHKPHGSLDWALRNGSPVCTHFNCVDKPLIITPGNTKYRRGYNQPFDSHIAFCNNAIDTATALLFIGYGFNDDHLQTHLNSRIDSGVSGLILSKGLTDSAKSMVKKSSAFIALSQTDDGSTLVTTCSEEWRIDNHSIWDIENFVNGVLAP